MMARAGILPILATVALLSAGCPLTHLPRSCCGNLGAMPPLAIRITEQIATRADEVPAELQGCGFNFEEITAITLNGTFAGCPTVARGARMIFPSLDVEFTTDGARCRGGRGRIAHRLVTLTHVVYNATLDAGPPPCVRTSSVTDYTFESHDPGFNTLFTTAGPQTLLPILDRYALAWATTPPMTCPPAPRISANTSRCP
jgi:hypothetical protein